ncbi:MAG: hypothetical protein U0835_02395 [Isosphaeraceae bacterium]
MAEQTENPLPTPIERIDKELDFIHHRMTWLLGSQAILVSGYAVLVKDLVPGKTALESLVLKVKCLGLISSVLLFSSVTAALFAIRYFRKLPDAPAQSFEIFRLIGHLGHALLPVVFCVFWMIEIHEVVAYALAGLVMVLIVGVQWLWSFREEQPRHPVQRSTAG